MRPPLALELQQRFRFDFRFDVRFDFRFDFRFESHSKQQPCHRLDSGPWLQPTGLTVRCSVGEGRY